MIDITLGCTNRKGHNKLICEIFNRYIKKYTRFYRGHLYNLGCGEMPYEDWIPNYADHYTGVDWRGSLHELKADLLADLKPLPIDGQVVDTVLSNSVVEHLRDPQVLCARA